MSKTAPGICRCLRIGLVGASVLYGGMTSEIGDMYAENRLFEEYSAVLRLDLAEITDSVKAVFVTSFGLLASIYTVSNITRFRGEETSLRAENILTTEVSRIR